MSPTADPPSGQRARIESPERSACQAIDRFDRQIHERHGQQLVVERRRPQAAEDVIQRDDTRRVEDAEQDPSKVGSRRCRGIREKEMHAKKHCDRNVRVDEVVRAGRRKIEQPKHVHGDHGRHGHRRNAEEKLPRQRDEEDEQID